MTMWSKAACAAGLDAMVGLVSAAGAGAIWIYEGPPPASVDAPATGTKLVIVPLARQPFERAIGTMVTARNIASTMASADGRAGYFRLVNNAGVPVAQEEITMGEIARDARIDIMECVVTMDGVG